MTLHQQTYTSLKLKDAKGDNAENLLNIDVLDLGLSEKS